jgi:hypothetical protein
VQLRFVFSVVPRGLPWHLPSCCSRIGLHFLEFFGLINFSVTASQFHDDFFVLIACPQS